MRSSISLKRPQPRKSPRARFTIFSEGENTEPDYFRALKTSLNNTLIEIVVFGKAGVPNTIKNSAMDLIRDIKRSKLKRVQKDSFEEGDQVWVCFDRDEHHKVKETIDNCVAAGIRVAFSNPCFELWLIMHLEDYDRPLDRHKVQKHLERICSGYDKDKGKTAPFESLLTNRKVAEGRAIKMLARRREEGSEFQAPWTDVHVLTMAISNASEKAR